MKKRDKIREKISLLPHLPGVYQFFDVAGVIIYVGKAKDLKKRVSSYFVHKINQSAKIRVMLTKIADIKHIVVATESDALFLENNLIKKYQPRYNILLKDDKTYPWLCLKNETFPRIFVTRRKVNDGSCYFGPYSSATTIRFLLDLMRRTYNLRTCNLALSPEAIEKGKFKACLEYHIGNCKAPCIGLQSIDDYNSQVEQVVAILNGDIKVVMDGIKKEMTEAADEYRFEEAQQLKEKYKKLENYQSKSIVVSSINYTVDVVSILIDENIAFANFLRVVKGSVNQSQTVEMKLVLEETPKSLLSYVLAEMTSRVGPLSREIIVPFLPEQEFANHVFTVPKRGDKLKLLELSMRNVKTYQFERLKQMKIIDPERYSNRILVKLQKDLQLNTLPRHIECFDISNISGAFAVGACVVFKDAKPSKKDYRKYNIKDVEGTDDYASMREVVRRRYSKIIDEKGELPDLIIVDGGLGHMETVRKVVEDELGLNLAIAGLAKDSKHRTKELLFGFPPKVLGIKASEPYFKMLVAIQNEVHRFAITFHRNKRKTAMLKSELTEIKGVGEKSAEKLLSKFKSISKISNLSVEELSDVLGSSQASEVFNYFAQKRK